VKWPDKRKSKKQEENRVFHLSKTTSDAMAPKRGESPRSRIDGKRQTGRKGRKKKKKKKKGGGSVWRKVFWQKKGGKNVGNKKKWSIGERGARREKGPN